MANQDKDADLKSRFVPIAASLKDNEEKIAGELLAAQGEPMDIGGYFDPDGGLTGKAMRPSATLNGIVDAM